jgi:hypothetical protein
MSAKNSDQSGTNFSGANILTSRKSSDKSEQREISTLYSAHKIKATATKD